MHLNSLSGKVSLHLKYSARSEGCKGRENAGQAEFLIEKQAGLFHNELQPLPVNNGFHCIYHRPVIPPECFYRGSSLLQG